MSIGQSRLPVRQHPWVGSLNWCWECFAWSNQCQHMNRYITSPVLNFKLSRSKSFKTYTLRVYQAAEHRRRHEMIEDEDKACYGGDGRCWHTVKCHENYHLHDIFWVACIFMAQKAWLESITDNCFTNVLNCSSGGQGHAILKGYIGMKNVLLSRSVNVQTIYDSGAILLMLPSNSFAFFHDRKYYCSCEDSSSKCCSYK